MYRKLVLYRNELKSKNIPKYKIIGILSELTLSKAVFSSNSDVELFLQEVFQIKYKPYVIRSRTMIIARLTRDIIAISNDNLYKSALYSFIEKKIEEMKN